MNNCLKDCLSDFQYDLNEWLSHTFPDSTTDDQLIGIGEEFGELCHAHLKLKQKIRMEENHEENIKDAIGDITIFLINYCNKKKINFVDCVELAWVEIKNRDWRKEK